MRKSIIRSSASEWFVVESFLAHYPRKWRKMINVKQEDDNTFTISWDENDPQESIFNDWTEQDFINAIQDYLNTLQELGEVDNATEAINQVTEYFIDQTPEEVQQDIINAEKYLNFDSKNVQESNYEGFNQSPEDYKLSQGGDVSPPEHFPHFP